MAASPDPIDQILALDLGARGIAGFFVRGGAAAAARALRGARRVLIATGFTVAPDTPETDGPPGAVVLGQALCRLGARVRYVTDPPTVPVLRAALAVLAEPPDIITYPEREGAAAAILNEERPTHLVAIERPGRSASGEYLNLRGLSVDAWNRRIDDLFLENDRTRGRAVRRAITIGIGDGGNEIGMGNVRGRVAREGAVMQRIASVVRVDHLVVAGTSNWGAYGVVAALARTTGRDLLHTPELERRLIDACVASGAADGITRRREPTVDGLSLDVHAAIVTLLRGGRQPSALPGIIGASRTRGATRPRGASRPKGATRPTRKGERP